MATDDVQAPPAGTDTPPPVSPEVRDRAAAEFIELVLASAKNPKPRTFPETGQTVHYTELTPGDPASPLAAEWEAFRRELPRLLAEGNEGRFVLIKGEQVVGLWDTYDAALTEADRRYPRQPFAVQAVREWQPLLRTGSRAKVCPA